MAKMNYEKIKREDALKRRGPYSENDYKAHHRALRKAWALWKQGRGPKPVWNEPAPRAYSR